MVEVEGKKAGQHAGGAQPQDIDAPGPDDGVDHGVEILAGDLLLGAADLVGIGGHDPVQDIHPAGELFVDDLHALHGGQPVADDILQRLLQLGIALEAQLSGKAHHGGFADPDRFAQLGGGHKGCLIIMLQNKAADPFLSLGKIFHLRDNQLKQILCHDGTFSLLEYSSLS